MMNQGGKITVNILTLCSLITWTVYSTYSLTTVSTLAYLAFRVAECWYCKINLLQSGHKSWPHKFFPLFWLVDFKCLLSFKWCMFIIKPVLHLWIKYTKHYRKSTSLYGLTKNTFKGRFYKQKDFFLI